MAYIKWCFEFLSNCFQQFEDIQMNDVENGIIHNVHVVSEGCFEKFKRIWNAWSYTTRICVVATGCIVIVGTILSIGMVAATAIGTVIVAQNSTRAEQQAGINIVNYNAGASTLTNLITNAVINCTDVAKKDNLENIGNSTKKPKVKQRTKVTKQQILFRGDQAKLFEELKEMLKDLKKDLQDQGYYNSTNARSTTIRTT